MKNPYFCFCMKYLAEIDVMPQKALLDPQGKTVGNALKKLGIPGTGEVRIGKHISVEIEADNEEEAMNIAKTSCEKLLHNPVMEYYEIKIQPYNG